jgi:hypothetical protein
VLEAEWYVSLDGEQFGPFSLSRAQDWVESRQPDDELHCWSEGFDDWLPVEKVSHFRGLRGQALSTRQGSGLMSMSSDGPQMMTGGPDFEAASRMPHHEATPVPLFAATLAQVVAETQGQGDREQSQVSRVGRRNGSSVSALGLPSSRPPMPSSAPAQSGGSLFGSAMAAANQAGPRSGETLPESPHDLEIGEASRVVKLPMLARQSGGGAPLGAPGLPGVAGPGAGINPIGRGTGSNDQPSGVHSGLPIIRGAATVDLPRPEILMPRRRRASGMMMPIAIGSAVVVGVVSVLLYVALAGEDEDDLVRRGRLGDRSGLAYQFDDGEAGEGGKKAADKAPATGAKGGARRVARKTGTRSGQTAATTQVPVGPDNDEVDLSGSARELDPDDLFDVYNANKIGVTMCYNSALKRDPLLQVRRADVLISVGTSGAVSSVSIPSLSGTPLGTCLERRIRAWRFPRATRIFTSQFPIIFQS